MKDIPIFATDYGVASITLNQIPYNQNAYIRIQSVSGFSEFVGECIDFCRAAGAKNIYATGSELLAHFEIYTRILQMEIEKADILGETGQLVLVTQDMCTDWKNAYNYSMKNVPGAAVMDDRLLKRTMEREAAYYVRYQGLLVGLGVVSGETVQAIAALQPHMGGLTLKTLATKIEGNKLLLEVAENNLPAVKLYNRCKGEIIRCNLMWHKIF